MLRFCDKDVYCIGYDELERGRLLSYFLDGNRRTIICVKDENEKYIGMISYSSLINCDNVYNAIEHEAVVLDENIWKKGRDFFKNKDSIDISNGDVIYLPILDKEGNLLYFAYQDDEANKEIRMLWELMHGNRKYLNFTDIYSEYDCVTIQGCNELAWYFVQYLNSIGVPVNVEGEIWQQLGDWEWHETVDYRNLRIYAEGTWPKEENILKYILRSVSVEFECIDRIYEENIKTGLIRDIEVDLETLLATLRKEKEIVILGTDSDEQDTYDFLYGYGIDISCFCSSDYKEHKYRLLGKPVIGIDMIARTLKHPVFIECQHKNSTLSGDNGELDRMSYMGYHRNHQIFFIQDYSMVPRNQLQNVLNSRELVLAGNYLLCQRLKCFFEENRIGKNICYIGEIDECTTRIQESVFCLIVEPIYYFRETIGFADKWRARVEQFAKRVGMFCYTEYFSSDVPYLDMERDSSKYSCSELRPKGIMIGAIQAFCGNYLMQDIFDVHPDILMMEHGFLCNNLYYICLMLAQVKSVDILEIFWYLYDTEVQNNNIQNPEFYNPSVFNEEMKRMLAKCEYFTSQELFVMFHIAYTAMYGKKSIDFEKVFIYFEPHFVERNICGKYAVWLNEKRICGTTLSISRNACTRAGSGLKLFIRQRKAGWSCIWNSVDLKENEEECNFWEKLNIRFEDIKCHPKETLSLMCEKTGLSWSETMLNPRKVDRPEYSNGFELKPVYNNYEEYFSEFDRMRILMVNYLWQKKYGYPNFSGANFTAKDIQEMFLKEFRFEKYYNYANEEVQILCKLNIKKKSNASLQKIKRLELGKIGDNGKIRN